MRHAHPTAPRALGSPPAYRVACDSLVALGSATIDGAVHFAKNSDRPAAECQPLTQVPRRQHPADARVRCTYVEIPQHRETARVIGSRPFWCWGFEHGANEYGVAIGNHTVFTKDTLSEPGLIGMDLVRLGLERGRNAADAVSVMTELIERYGQGGSGYHDKNWPYHNSFLVADPKAAFIVETSDRHWAIRQVNGGTDNTVASVSNHLTIGDNWDALSDGAIEYAITRGWWNEAREDRFNFAEAYRDSSTVPDAVSSGRHQRTCRLLEDGIGTLSVDALKRALRDHYGRTGPPTGLTPDDAHYFSVCMHAEPVGTTTASMIARLAANADEPVIYWASLGSPCVSAFIPLFLDGDIPAILTRGGHEPSKDSAWWQFKALLTRVEADWQRHAPVVRETLDAFEAETTAQARALAVRSASAAERTAFMEAVVKDLLDRVRRLSDSLSR